MAEAAGLVVLEKVVEKSQDTICRLFSYIFCFNTKIKNLKDGIQELQNKRDGVKRLADAAEWNTEITGADVVAWLMKVEDVKCEAHKVDEDAKNVKNGCLNGWGPKGVVRRYLIGKKAVKQNLIIVGLQEEGNKHTRFSYPALPSGMVAPASAVGHEVFESRISMMKEILETLKNDEISTIGICGLGGIGKTKMVKEIRKSSIVENLFDEVAMAVVSQKQELSKIQGELAKMLGLDLDEKESTDARAEKLHKRLMQDNRSLLILDDVWKQLDLGEVGIPIQGEGRCKVLLTTRDEQVCSMMRTQKTFKVELLSDEEAWDLFKDKAGDCVETTDIHPIAKNVLNECGRLPLAIVIVGSALNGAKEYAWHSALQQLKMSTAKNIKGMDADVYSILQLSYDYLNQDQHTTQEKKSNGIQRLFLLCCLFREDYDIPIEYLVRYAVGLRMFEDVQNLAAARNRVQDLTDRLKNCYLLLDSDEEGHVKMHDVVRDFGLAFATEGEHVYMVKHNTGLEEWPENGQTSTAITLSEEGLDLPIHLDCPRLMLLQLSAEGSIEISRDYFGGMKELRVVAFRNKSIFSEQMVVEAPPKAIQFFMNVRSLSLEYCRFSSHLGFIGSLQKLEILSFYASKIDVLPNEIGLLSNLKLLDLRCEELGLIPLGVLSCLSKLEALYMGNYFHGDGFEERRHGASVTELNKLARMRTLQVYVSDPDLLLELQDAFLKALLRFNISVSRTSYKFQGDDGGYEFPNVLILNSEALKTKMNVLRSRIEVLEVENMQDLETIAHELDQEGFLKLRSIDIYNCAYMREMCEGCLPARSFEKLKIVNLRYLNRLECLWRGPIEPPCLNNLTYIYLTDCCTIKSLFPQSVSKCLVQLQELHLRCCKMLEEIVSKEGPEYEKVDKMIEFPKLQNLTLRSLPRLRSFTPISDIHRSESYNHDVIIQPLLNQVILPGLETLHFRDFNVKQLVGGLIASESLYKLIDLKLVSCSEVLHIAASNSVQLLQKLEKLEVSVCVSVETVFDFEGRERAEVMLPQLDSLKLDRLPMLTHIWKMVPKGIRGFQNLRDLSIFACDSLRYLFSPCIVELLMNLQSIKLYACRMMEVVVQMNEEEQCSSSEIQKMDKFVFHQLRVLELGKLPIMTMFCRGNNDIEFPSLDEMVIKGCSQLRNLPLVLPKSTQSFQNLRKLFIRNCQSWRYLFTPSMAKILVNLQEMEVTDCSMMEVIIQKEEEDDYCYSSGVEKIDKLVFPRLQRLRFNDLKNLTMFCCGNHDIRFPSLVYLFIYRCPKMMHFCSGQLSTPKLKKVRYNHSTKDSMGDLNSTIRHLNERQ